MGNANTKQIEQHAKETGEFQLNSLQLTEIPKFKLYKIDISKITKFNVEENRLTSVPKHLEKLINLTELNLSKNNITHFSTPALPHLVKIDLGFNPLVELDSNLYVAPNLVSVVCYGCNLTRVPVECLIRNPKLTIMVNSNSLTIGDSHIPPEVIPQLLGLNDQKVPSEILENFLYLGSVNSAQNWEGLEERKITNVICMVSMHKLPFEEKLKYKLVKIDDIEIADIKQHFADINSYIDNVKQNGGRVLVHCAAGVSRSGSAVLAYIMASQKLNYSEALAFVSRRRPCVCPNSGFERQLREYEVALQEGS